MSRADRRLLKKAGFGREYKEMGALACALEEVKNAPYVPGYAVEAGWLLVIGLGWELLSRLLE